MNRLQLVFKKYPVTKGIAAYAVLWPSSDLCRQLAVKGNQKDEKYATCNEINCHFLCYIISN